jgi:hypothetical protein
MRLTPTHVEARDLANALLRLGELEFRRPEYDFAKERASIRTRIEVASRLGESDFHDFAKSLIHEVSSLCLNPSANSEEMYRAFDGVDELLAIDYSSEELLESAGRRSERLYENSGVRVQTSYMTIIKVLAHLQLSEGAHLVDLGSGYGRVGLTAGS